MNTFIDIDSPISKRLAQIAIFAQIQSWFQIYPARIAEKLPYIIGRQSIEGEDLNVVVCEAEIIIHQIFAETLKKVIDILEGKMIEPQEVNRDPRQEIKNYFLLDPSGIIRRIRTELAGAEESEHIEAAKYIAQTLPIVINWAFAKIREDLRLK